MSQGCDLSSLSESRKEGMDDIRELKIMRISLEIWIPFGLMY
jgi:hypothetical protein